jgi:hypothetical protein
VTTKNMIDRSGICHSVFMLRLNAYMFFLTGKHGLSRRGDYPESIYQVIIQKSNFHRINKSTHKLK